MHSSRKALCVGINKFKNLPSRYYLQGCVNDANDMEKLLTKYLGFSAKTNIVKLTDSQATKAEIMKNLTEMVKGANAGKYSYLVFSYSSHGTQIPDKNGDETDKYDEALCPYDIAAKGFNWDPRYIITDDELNSLFSQLPKNVLLEAYFDTCHSGTGLRAADLLIDRIPRYLPPPTYQGLNEVINSTPKGLRSSAYEKDLRHHILWAACKDNETSSDAQIEGAWHGAFTFYFVKEMKACQNKLSRAEILNKLKADLKKNGFAQNPQLEANATARKISVQ
jgi:metacaspase-1